MDNLELTQDEKKDLESLAQLGFAFSNILRKLPPHIADKYTGFYTKRGQRKIIAASVWKISSITKAIVLGYSPKERAEYLIKQRAKNENN